MKKNLLISFLFILSLSMMAQGTYRTKWLKVDNYEEQDLPASAVKEVDLILKQAIAERNNQQVVKALIHKNKYNYWIESNDHTELIASLLDLEKKTKIVAEKALLNSMLAELYMASYNENRWVIRGNASITGEIPSSMAAWSENIYFDKIITHSQLSIKDKKQLLIKTTGNFSEILEQADEVGNDIYPSLYDFLIVRAINLADDLSQTTRQNTQLDKSTGLSVAELAKPANEFVKLNINKELDTKNLVFVYMQEYMSSLIDRGMTSALIISELNKVKLLSSLSDGVNETELYRTLLEKYNSENASIEIRSSLINSIQKQSTPIHVRRNNPSKNTDIARINEEVYQIATEGKRLHPNYKRIGLMDVFLEDIELPYINLKVANLYHPDEEVNVEYNFNNMQAAKKQGTFFLVRMENGTPILVREYTPTLKTQKEYIEEKEKLELGKLPFGSYQVVFVQSDDAMQSFRSKIDNAVKQNNYVEFIVSQLTSYYRRSGEKTYEIFVVDRVNGKPIQNATVEISAEVKSEPGGSKIITKKLSTNKLGLALYNEPEEVDVNSYQKGTYKISLNDDTNMTENSLYGYGYYRMSGEAEYTSGKISIFTDRSVYRPGQTVFFKALAVNDSKKLQAKKTYTVKFFDSNEELLSTKYLMTNDFGSIASEFILPKTILLGSFSIDIDGERLYLNVEEYKRPTFEITFDKLKESYGYNESVTLKGKAETYSGISLQNMKVDYQITRRSTFMPFYGYDTFFDNGEVTTNENGEFSITFVPQKTDKKNRWLWQNTSTFEVTASITDINGETQAGKHPVIVGDVSMYVDIDLANQLEKSEIKDIKITAKNLAGEEISTSGSYQVYKLNEQDSIDVQAFEMSFKSGIQTDLQSKLRALESGKYRIKLLSLDSKQNKIENEKDFILFSYNDKEPPIKTDDWIVVRNTEFSASNPAQIIFGSSEETYTHYVIYNDTKVFKRDFINLDNKNYNLDIDYRSEYGDNVYLSLISVKNNNLASRDILLTKEEEQIDNELVLKLDVFRDKLRPGQDETWTLSVKDKSNKAVIAEVLASMYDKSLDQIVPQTPWSINMPYNWKRSLQAANYSLSGYFSEGYDKPMTIEGLEHPEHEKVNIKFARVNWFGYPVHTDLSTPRGLFQLVNLGGIYARHAMLSENAVVSTESIMAKQSTVSFKPAPIEESEMDVMVTDASGGGNAPQIRSDFNETAFFYPQLRTNKDGETLIEFKVPESNTKWSFRVLAHDIQLRNSQIEKEVITQKELMVTPNMPRFIRQGDKTSISTKISNLSDKALNGQVSIEFFNPITQELIALNVKNKEQKFNLAIDASSSASWEFDVPSDMDLIACRIVAQTADFSDGEQHALAILPNRMLVTETMPFDVVKGSSNNFNFDSFASNKSSSLENYRLTLEYTNNAAWYAVMAMPSLSNPSNDNALNWIASYYVNTIGASLVSQNPRVASVIKAWKQQQGSKETLVSKLNQNEELKNILLEETPWMADARNEDEMMNKLSLLFDINNTQALSNHAVRKLKELQTVNGGWSWLKGFGDNRFVTQYILYCLSNVPIVAQVELPEDVKIMQMQALKYVDEQIAKDYKNLQETTNWKNSTSVSTNQLEYLYTRSFYRDIPISHEAREAERHYTKVASGKWKDLDLYEKSILAVLLNRNGDNLVAGQIAQSLREYSKTDENLGMYWPNNKTTHSNSLSFVSLHTFLMDALKVNGATKEELDLMKQWLVKQKQTQSWGTTLATVDAISTLLKDGSDWFTATDQEAKIKIGSKSVDTKDSQLATGYMKTSWVKSEISKDMAKVSVEKQNDAPSYGAIYWQYYEDLNKVSAEKGELNIEKKLYKKETTSKGVQLVPIDNNNPIHVGDEIVMRLTITSDRTMDFVHIKDMRASCFEPVSTTSGNNYSGGLSYYQTTKDASTNFFVERLAKGTYVLEYSVYANRTGEYANGITSIQSMYVPEYSSHTAGIKVIVKDK